MDCPPDALLGREWIDLHHPRDARALVPTATTIGNGDVLILSGTDQDSLYVVLPEVWSNGSVLQLTGASRALPWYPRAFLAPDGSIFNAGPTSTQFFSVSGSWRKGPTRLDDYRDYGSAVMYDDGKILYDGVGNTTRTAEVIDLNEPPVWRWTGSMAYPRRDLNATVLPTGEVLATGGVSGPGFNNINTAVHAAEIWNPATGQWTVLASNVNNRGYHQTSVRSTAASLSAAASTTEAAGTVP